MMTEEEAKLQWCPFARLDPYKNGPECASVNRDQDGKPFVFCIGSACMAWRSRIPHDPERDKLVDIEPADPKAPVVPHGFCGLAGKP